MWGRGPGELLPPHRGQRAENILLTHLVDGMLAGEAQPTWPTQEDGGLFRRAGLHVGVGHGGLPRPVLPALHDAVRFGEIAESWPRQPLVARHRRARPRLLRRAAFGGPPARGLLSLGEPRAMALCRWGARPPPGRSSATSTGSCPARSPGRNSQSVNDVERELLRAAANNDQQTLAATDVLLPVPGCTNYTMRPGRPGFPWQTREVDGSTVVPVTASTLSASSRRPAPPGPAPSTSSCRSTIALRYWPDHDWPLAVTSGSPAGGTVLAQQLPGLARVGRPARLAAQDGRLRTPERRRGPPVRGRPPPRHRRLLQYCPLGGAGPRPRRPRHARGHRPRRARLPVAARHRRTAAGPSRKSRRSSG